MTKRQRIIVLILTGCIALILVRLFMGRKSEGPPRVASEKQIKYVATQVVQADSHALMLSTYGRVRSFRDVLLSAEVQGELLSGEVTLKAGSSFRKGQVLFRINDADARLSLLARRSQFVSTVAQILPDLKLDIPEAYEKWMDFYGNIQVEQALPELPNVEDIKEKTYLAARNVLSDYYSIKSDETRLAKYTVRAPFSGSLVEVFSEPHAVVNPGANIARIIQQDQLEVLLPVQAEDIRYVETGHEVSIYNQQRDSLAQARVARISKVINQNTQTIDVYATLIRPEQAALYDGMYIEARIAGPTLENVAELPRRALLDGGYVHLLSDSNLIKTPVSIVKRSAESVLVRGLNSGQQVVVEPVTISGSQQVFVSLESAPR